MVDMMYWYAIHSISSMTYSHAHDLIIAVGRDPLYKHPDVSLVSIEGLFDVASWTAAAASDTFDRELLYYPLPAPLS
jgi:hypothetical protein